MTREELKAVLKSPANSLGKTLAERVAAGATPQEAQAMLDQGATLVYYERDPSHPRSRYFVRNVLDACFDSRLTAIEKPSKDPNVFIADLRPKTTHGDPETFRLLLQQGGEPGETAWRGQLFKHILMMACLRHGGNTGRTEATRNVARAMFEVLWQERPDTAKLLARHSYDWVRNPEALQWLLDLGMEVNQELMAHAILYAGCESNCGEDIQDGGRCLLMLLDRGAKPIPVGDPHTRAALNRWGLADIFPQKPNPNLPSATEETETFAA
jgi:hypothetical protein